MAASGDANGTMVEVYPERATLDIPANDDQVVFGENPQPPHTWPFHFLLSVPLEVEQVERIGAREGWRTKTFGRGKKGHTPFLHVIEFWVENRLMIEVATPAMTQEYLQLLQGIQPAAMSDPESLLAGCGRHTSKRRRDSSLEKVGSGGRIRTYDQSVNSRLLYR